MIDFAKLFFSRSRFSFNIWGFIATVLSFVIWNWDHNFDCLQSFYLRLLHLRSGDTPEHVRLILDDLAPVYSVGLAKLTIVIFLAYVFVKLLHTFYLNPEELDRQQFLASTLERNIEKKIQLIEKKLEALDRSVTRSTENLRSFREQFKDTRAEIEDINKQLSEFRKVGEWINKLGKQILHYSNELNKVIANSLHRAVQHQEPPNNPELESPPSKQGGVDDSSDPDF